MKLKILIYFILIFSLLYSCSKHDTDVTTKPGTLDYMELFKSQSPFYNSIPSNAQTDPNSEIMIQGFVEQSKQGFVIAVKKWTVAVYNADANTPLHEVKLTAYWAPENKLVNVPIPDYAEPDPSDDGSMVIIDQNNGCIYDFWKMRNTMGKWKAGWGNALPLESNGIFPKGFSARGSGFELLQGVIWPQELEKGEINHALIFSYDYTRSGGFVSPATESDGTSDGIENIPEGALLQLNPDLDLSLLNLNDYELTVAKAMQKYGMYCADDGGGVQLYAINPVSFSKNPYENIWGDKTYVDLSKIPAGQFRVLKLPPQQNGEPELVSNSCAEFR